MPRSVLVFALTVIVLPASAQKAPDRVPAPAFDGKDVEKTAKWVQSEARPVFKARGNPFAWKKAHADLEADFARLKGKTVRWRFKVKGVSERGGQAIIALHNATAPPTDDLPYTSHLTITTPPTRKGLGSSSPASRAVLLPSDTVAALRPGDWVTVGGTVVGTQVAGAGLILRLDRISLNGKPHPRSKAKDGKAPRKELFPKVELPPRKGR